MIFVSYSRTRRWAAAVRRAAGTIPVWLDYEQLDLSRAVASQIEAAIERSDAVVVLDSPRARTSGWVAFERSLARRHGVPMRWLTGGRVPEDLASFAATRAGGEDG